MRRKAAAHLDVGGEGIEGAQREQEQGGQFPGDHIDGRAEVVREKDRGETNVASRRARLWGGAAPSSTQLASLAGTGARQSSDDDTASAPFHDVSAQHRADRNFAAGLCLRLC